MLELAAAAALPASAVVRELHSTDRGLSSAEAQRRLIVYGPNALLSHGVSALSVLVRQVRSYLLLLLVVAAVVSAVVGDRAEALIIGGIMLMSVGLGFLNEYRSEKAVEALHSQIRHQAFVDRDGEPQAVNVGEIVPGDLVHLRVGDVIPADLRLIETHELECDGLIRRFMAFFGPISSVYDFLTFAVMLRVFHAGSTLFRSGWFVESLATQTLVIFVIRTRRVPFVKSRPSRPLLAATLACAAVGIALPYVGPFARLFGFRALPLSFLAMLAGMIVTYLVLAQVGVALFFKPQGGRALARTVGRHERDVRRRAARWHRWPHRDTRPPAAAQRTGGTITTGHGL